MDLSSDTLFVNVPTGTQEAPSIDTPIDIPLNYQTLITNTYHLIKLADLNQQLKLWEIRLLSLLFDNQLAVAKREAINLNNAIFLFDSPKQPQNVLIYPLPKNNDSAIQYSLLVLILRLKSVPNLNMLNELYKLTYQSRLKGDSNQTNLTNLSYDVIAVLSINKNYISLLNHLRSVKDQSNDKQYLSNTNLLLILVECLAAKANGRKQKIDTTLWEEVNSNTRDSLVYVLQNINPLISSDTKPSYSTIQELTLPELLKIVESGGITGRILCSTLGLWELSNNYDFSLAREDGKMVYKYTGEEVVEGEYVDRVFTLVRRNWVGFIHKVYGLE